MCWLVCKTPFTIQQNQKNISAFHLKCSVHIFSNKQTLICKRLGCHSLLFISRPWIGGCVQTAQPLDWKGAVKWPAVHSPLAWFFVAFLSKSMSKTMTLLWGAGSPHCWRVMIVLEEKKLQGYKRKLLSFEKGEHKSQEVVKVNPRGQVRWSMQ